MSEREIDTGFEKFLTRFRKSLEKVLSTELLRPVVVEINNNRIKICTVDQNSTKLSLRRVFRNNYSTRLISHLVEAGLSEPTEFEFPLNYEPSISSCYFLIRKEELKKV